MTETEHGKTTTWTVGEAIQIRFGTRWRNGRLEEIQIDNETNEIRIGYSFNTDLTDRVHYISLDKVRKHGELNEEEWNAYEKREKANEKKAEEKRASRRGSKGRPPTSGPGRWKTDTKWEMKAWREKTARNKERYGKD